MTDKNVRNQFSKLIKEDSNYQKFVREIQNIIVNDFQIEILSSAKPIFKLFN